MTNLRCTRRPQSSRNLTVNTVYENAVLYTQGMAPTEDFSEAYYVFLINNNGTNTRYRASLFEVAAPVVPITPINITLDHTQIAVIFDKPTGHQDVPYWGVKVTIPVDGKTLILFDSVEDSEERFEIRHPGNAFSCGVRLVTNVGDVMVELTTELIRERISEFIEEESTPTRPININIGDVTCEVIARAIIMHFKNDVSNCAFLLMSLLIESRAFELFSPYFDTISDGRINPNSDNQIMIGIINTIT